MDNYRTIETRLNDRAPFKGNSMSAQFEKYDGETYYVVYSYQMPIAWHKMSKWEYSVNPEKVSVTTSRHQNLVRKAWGI